MATSTSTLYEGGKAGPKNPGTQREDNWWVEPTLIFVGLTSFLIYGTYRALQGFVDPTVFEGPGGTFLTENHHDYLTALGYAFYGNGAHYVSPLGSPDLSPLLAPIIGPITQLLKNLTGWEWFVLSPAMWILWVPGGFRLTCYYYRKAYYRSFFSAPSACAVNQPVAPTAPFLGWLLGKGSNYRGESVFPIIVQNFHRYFFYVSALFILILSLDAVISYFFQGAAVTGVDGKVTGHLYHFGISVGSLVLTLNALLLGLYTFSCHSWRHILGGMLDSFSACGAVGKMRHHAWQRQTILNEHHMLFAWISLVWVGFTDFYIWQLAQGNWQDMPLFHLTKLAVELPL